MKKYFWILLVATTILGCTSKGKVKFSRSFIDNRTVHPIEIIIYKRGQIVSVDQSKKLPALSRTEVEYISEGITSYGFGLIGYDSLEVKFANIYSSIHYLNAEGNNISAIKRGDPRNLYDGVGWEKKIVEDTRRKLVVEHTYTFTEQDYSDAKK